MTKRTRLSRRQRRRLLLDVTKGIVGANGADALTIVLLAEAAGVTQCAQQRNKSAGWRPGLLREDEYGR
jgi:hypothetical protein